MLNTALEHWEKNYGQSVESLPIGYTDLEYFSVHKVFTQSDEILFQPILGPVQGNVRLVAIFCDVIDVFEHTSVGISFCVSNAQLGEKRYVPLKTEFPLNVHFQDQPFFKVLSLPSSTPALWYLAQANHQMHSLIASKIEPEEMANLGDLFKKNQHVHKNGTAVSVPATLDKNNKPKNLVGYYLDQIKYTHPTLCVPTNSHKDVNGERGYVMPFDWYEKVRVEMTKSITDCRPLINFKNVGILVSANVKYLALTITVFYSA